MSIRGKKKNLFCAFTMSLSTLCEADAQMLALLMKQVRKSETPHHCTFAYFRLYTHHLIAHPTHKSRLLTEDPTLFLLGSTPSDAALTRCSLRWQFSGHFLSIHLAQEKLYALSQLNSTNEGCSKGKCFFFPLTIKSGSSQSLSFRLLLIKTKHHLTHKLQGICI